MMWLLLAALPVQGWAVATMVNCGPTHHRMAPAAPDAAEHAHHGHSHDAHDGSGHDPRAHTSHHHGDAAEGQAQPDDADTHTDTAPLSLGKFKCSACATCCLGMALPSTAVTFDAAVSSDTVEPHLPQPHVVFLTAGLERPPRSHLA